MKHVVVCGGAGFLGSHLCWKLVKEGYVVTCIDNLSTGTLSNIEALTKMKNFAFVDMDICNGDWRLIPNGDNVEGIINLACPASPTDFKTRGQEILLCNSIGVLWLTKVARQLGCRFVQASTSEVYGDPEQHPQNEKYNGNVSTLSYRAAYDEGKRFAEAVIATHSSDANPWRPGIVRIFNTYGPNMRPNDGRVIPSFVSAALKGEALHINNGGQQTRSFCYVDDLVDGLFRFFQSDLFGPVNIGGIQEITIKELAETVVRTCGRGSIIGGHFDEYDPKVRRPDIGLARRSLGWEPTTSLEQGLEQTIRWFKAVLN